MHACTCTCVQADYERKNRVMDMLGTIITPQLTVPERGASSIISYAMLKLSTAADV